LKSDILMVHCVLMYIRDINKRYAITWLIERIIRTLKKKISEDILIKISQFKAHIYL